MTGETDKETGETDKETGGEHRLQSLKKDYI